MEHPISHWCRVASDPWISIEYILYRGGTPIQILRQLNLDLNKLFHYLRYIHWESRQLNTLDYDVLSECLLCHTKTQCQPERGR